MTALRGSTAIMLGALLLNTPTGADDSQFEIGTPGYLMKACEEALDGKNTFRAGYCLGVYSTTHASRLLRFGVVGSEYCPTKPMKADVNVGLIVDFIKNHPKTWHTGEDFYSVELALKKAWPCK